MRSMNLIIREVLGVHQYGIRMNLIGKNGISWQDFSSAPHGLGSYSQ